MPELPYLQARELIELFRSRQLSPVEHLGCVIEQIDKHDPAINAVVDRRYDEALLEARAAEQRYLGHGDAARPMEGICVAVKATTS